MVAQYVRIFFLFKSSDTFAVEVTFLVVKSATVPPLSTYLSFMDWFGGSCILKQETSLLIPTMPAMHLRLVRSVRTDVQCSPAAVTTYQTGLMRLSTPSQPCLPPLASKMDCSNCSYKISFPNSNQIY